MSDTFDLIMAAYQTLGSAHKDFDALVKAVKDKTVSRGASTTGGAS